MHHQLEKHYVNRVGWLRAAVLGANDGLLSTTSIVIGVAAASPDRNTIILAALAGMIAGAMSMAAGEYVSVSSQEDTEKADLLREKRELEEMPEVELLELAKIYEKRGVSKETALKVATELTEHDALAAHAHDELGINEITGKTITGCFGVIRFFCFGSVTAVYRFTFGSLKGNGLFSIWLFYYISDDSGRYFSKNRRLKNRNRRSQNLFLGNGCDGNYGFNRASFRGYGSLKEKKKMRVGFFQPFF
jgi:VIT1/CCC1 family predicted Fe2+/Mn2+ transporter